MKLTAFVWLIATLCNRTGVEGSFVKSLFTKGVFSAVSSSPKSADSRARKGDMSEDSVGVADATCMYAKDFPKNDYRPDEYGGDEERISVGENRNFSPLQVMCEVNGYMIPAIIDTGAQITIMSSSCAKRCRINSNIDTRYSGRAVGVGSSDIIGRISCLPMRIGPINFDGCVSVLHESRVDFLIGLDFLKRFKCEISMKNNMLTLIARKRVFKVPLMTGFGLENDDADLIPHSQSHIGDEEYYSELGNEDSSQSDSLSDHLNPLVRDRGQSHMESENDSYTSAYSSDIYSDEELFKKHEDKSGHKRRLGPISGLVNTLSNKSPHGGDKEEGGNGDGESFSISLEGV